MICLRSPAQYEDLNLIGGIIYLSIRWRLSYGNRNGQKLSFIHILSYPSRTAGNCPAGLSEIWVTTPAIEQFISTLHKHVNEMKMDSGSGPGHLIHPFDHLRKEKARTNVHVRSREWARPVPMLRSFSSVKFTSRPCSFNSTNRITWCIFSAAARVWAAFIAFRFNLPKQRLKLVPVRTK